MKSIKDLFYASVLFVSIVLELPRQMLICLLMDNDKYVEIQEEKFRSEVREGLEKEKVIK